MSLLNRIRAWWNKDEIERVQEEAGMSPEERRLAEEDFEGRKDDTLLKGGYFAEGTGDFESDSERPRH